MTPQNYAFAISVGSSVEARHSRLGGPDAVKKQLESDRTDKDVLYESKLLKPFRECRADLKEHYGFSFGENYSAT
jgi:hypothetical protein